MLVFTSKFQKRFEQLTERWTNERSAAGLLLRAEVGAGRDPASVVRRVRAGLHLEQRVALVRTLPDQRTPDRPRRANRLQHLVNKANFFFMAEFRCIFYLLIKSSFFY